MRSASPRGTPARSSRAPTSASHRAGHATELDLIGADFAGRVEHRRSPVGRDDLEDLRAAAGASVAVFYSRSGYTKTAVLWAEEHRIALFGYTDTGYAAPVNQCAVELVHRGQTESEQHVRVATELVARRATAARQAAERREREAHAEVLRAENEAREVAERRRVARARSETLLGRTVVLLLADPARPRRARAARSSGSPSRRWSARWPTPPAGCR